MMHNNIRTTAYEVDPEYGPWIEQFEVHTFPEEWRKPLLDLYRHGWSDPDRPVSLPTRQLNGLLQAAAPGVVAIGGSTTEGRSEPWLYSTGQVPEELIQGLISTWVMGLRPGPEHEEQTLRTLEVVSSYVVRRSTERVPLDAFTLSAGGSGEPDRRLYALLPELLAMRLAERRFTGEGKPLAFRVVGSEQGAELVSWPPRCYRANERDWFYSAKIAITLQTVPFGLPRIHVSYGIRRWATRPPVLPTRKRIHVLVDAPRPWAQDERMTRLLPNSIAFDPAKGELGWTERSAVDLVPTLDVVRSYPEAADVVRDAEGWLRGRGDIAAAIVFHAATHRDHCVGPGLMPAERALLDAWIAEGLRPMLRRVPDYGRVFGRSNKPKLLPKIPKAEVERREAAAAKQAEIRSTSLAEIARTADGLEVIILWQNTETRDQLLTDFAESLGLPGPLASEGGEVTLRSGGAAVNLRCVLLPESLGAPLAIASGPRSARAKAVSAAIQNRREAMASHLEAIRSGAKITAAFVELDGRDAFEDDHDSDPKMALRLGCADAGAVTQFIQTPERALGSLEMRSHSAVHDLVRQCGLISMPKHTVGDAIAENTHYLALWYVRRTAAGPSRRAEHRLVALRVSPGDVEKPVSGWDGDSKCWLPYPDFLVALARGGNRLSNAADVANSSTDRTIAGIRALEVERQIRTLLYQMRGEPTVLLASMGNLRSVWRGLLVGALARDELTFQDQSTKRLALYGTDLSVVITRDANGREEIPEWYALGDKRGEEGFAVGLWQPSTAGADNRVFLSTADAASSAKGLRRDLRKLVPTKEWPHAPAKSAWNPQALEITVLGCPPKMLANSSDDSGKQNVFVQLASLVHQLRFTDAFEPLALPIPLHLAKLAAEYV